MGGWLLHVSFTQKPVPRCLPTGKPERFDVDLSSSLHRPQQPQYEPRQVLSTELRATATRWGFCTDIAAHTIAKDGRARVEGCVQWKVCTGMPLDRLGNTWLGSRLATLGDLNIWPILPIFINKFHRCHSIGDVRDWVTNRPLVELLVRPSLLWSIITKDLLLLQSLRITQMTGMTTS